LTANEGVLSDAGLFVPRAGRPDARSGHHNLAWELNDDCRFDPAHGSVADVLEEIARERAPRVCLTSEDFEYLHARPAALWALADGLHAVGYRPVVVVYLRPQAGYAESLYAELVKHGLAETFDVFLTTIVATGEFKFSEGWCFTFDYERLLADFAAVFGAAQIIARPYQSGADDVVEDFLRTIGGPKLPQRIARTPRLNAGLPCTEVLRLLERNTRSRGAPGSFPVGSRMGTFSGRFDPVHIGEVRRIVARFNAGNKRVQEKYGALVPCVSGRDLIEDVAAALGIDPAGRYRKRVIDATAQLKPAPSIREVPPAAPSGRIDERVFAPPFTQPARLEAVIVGTAALVAVAAITYGQPTGSTALVEYGMLSAIVALSAAALLTRYAIESHGLIADYRFFDGWGARLSALGYALVGLYALVNALLDVGVPRYEPDWFCYPGAIATAAATLILTIVGPLRRRFLGRLPRLATFEEVRDDRFYLTCSYVILVGQFAHVVDPAWWLDTGVDVLVVALAGTKVWRIQRSSGLLHAGRAA